MLAFLLPLQRTNLARFLSQQLILQAPSNEIIVVRWFQRWTASRIFCPWCQHWWSRSRARGSRHMNYSLLCKEPNFKHRYCYTQHRHNGSSSCVLQRNLMIQTLDEIWHTKEHNPHQRPFGNRFLSFLRSFQSITGCDTTSNLAGHTTKSCWKIFKIFIATS